MIQIKALYNLLRMNARHDPSVQAEPWALEDLRALSLPELFKRLERKNLHLDRKIFLEFAKEAEGPEELSELLLDESSDDEVFLVIFELWRRLLPERASLSVFCDELDHQIDRYDRETLESDEAIQDGFAGLVEILKEHVDAGMKPKEAFVSISKFCANDIESFLFDYISDLVDQGNILYASELLEEFTPFMSEPLYFDFLNARVLSETDIGEANKKIKGLLSKDLDLDLLFEVLQLLVAAGEHDLFQTAVKKMLPLLATEEEFLDLLELCADYYRRLDQEKEEQSILAIRNESAVKAWSSTDSRIKKLKAILTSAI